MTVTKPTCGEKKKRSELQEHLGLNFKQAIKDSAKANHKDKGRVTAETIRYLGKIRDRGLMRIFTATLDETKTSEDWLKGIRVPL